ncbi:hypothetical protein ACIXFI_16030 [Bacteroides fragilis]
MKKLVLMFVAIAAVSFASCGNKAADAEKATADSIRIADSIAADAEKATADSIRIADSIAADTTVVTETVVAE